MNIVLLYDKLNVGGTEKLLILIANLLQQKGNRVTVVLTQSKAILDHLISPDVEIVYLHRKNKFSVSPLKLLSKICSAADIIHIHTYFNYRYYFLAKMLFGSGNAKVVLHEHSNMFYINSVDKFLFSKLNAFIAVSAKQIELINKWKAVAQEKIFQISNIITVPDKVQAKQNPTFKILMVGNIRREKNYELALHIIEQLNTAISLDIYGNINDQKYFEELNDQIRNKGLSDRIKFIRGISDVSSKFNEYDLSIHTANHETGPLVLMEYLSAGLPFYTSTAGQAPAIISQHLPQVVIGNYDVNEWIEMIESFYKEPLEYRNQFSEELKKKADVIINVEDYYRQLINVYEHAQKN